MRLEEWQKYIESQFLEDATPAEKPEKAPRQVTRPAKTPDSPPKESALEPVSAQEAVVLDTLEATPRPTLPFAPTEEIDAEIPAFAHYLPAREASAQADASAHPLDTRRAVSKEELDALLTDPPPKPRPQPRRRNSHARHARNVRPEPTPSGLSAAELWAAVPRHVQTLLALGRQQESETAQSSYKRPFEEDRHELIARLLDPILSLEEAARLLNVCPTTVRRYTNRGILNHYRKEPKQTSKEGEAPEKETRQRRFRLSDILAFLEAQQVTLESDRQAEGAALRDFPER